MESSSTCGGQILNPPAYSVGGTWVLYMDPMAIPKLPPPAHITMNVIRNGSPYLMFDYLGLDPVSVEDGVYTYSAIGGVVTVTLDTRANTTPTMFFWAVQFDDNCTPTNLQVADVRRSSRLGPKTRATFSGLKLPKPK